MGLETAAILGPLIGAAGSVGGGLMGYMANMSAQDRAKLAQDEAVKQWLSINVPDPEQQKLALQHFVSSGQFTPQLETAIKQQESEMSKLSADPGLKEARLRALGSLEQQGYGGEQVQDTAAREKAIIDTGAANRGRQEAILGSMERRGQLGSGLELAARQQSAQSLGDQLASQGLDIESQRRQRALQAVQGAGSLAGDIQAKQWGMQSDQARAQDAINQFNAQMAAGSQQRNVAAQNAAGMYNIQNAQDIANRNVGVNNMQQQYNKELLQKQFQNEATKAGGLSGQYNQQAAQAAQQGQNAANVWGGVAQGIGQIGAGFANSDSPQNQYYQYLLDEKKKKVPGEMP